jgi:hypothetical protein
MVSAALWGLLWAARLQSHEVNVSFELSFSVESLSAGFTLDW